MHRFEKAKLLVFLFLTIGLIALLIANVRAQSDFYLSSSRTDLAWAPGVTATYTIIVNSVGNFSSPVSLQVTGAPAYANVTLSPILVTLSPGGNASSTLTITSQWSITSIGSYNLTVTGTSTIPHVTHSIIIPLYILPSTADFGLDANPRAPTPLIVQQGNCASYNITLDSVGSFAYAVNLTLLKVKPC